MLNRLKLENTLNDWYNLLTKTNDNKVISCIIKYFVILTKVEIFRSM